MLKKAKDPYAAMLLYRATPLHNGFSPAELLMSRKLQTKVPIIQASLTPATPNMHTVQSRESSQKDTQRQYFNQHHRAKTMPVLHPGTPVYIKDLSRHGLVTAQHHNPRSYIIQTDQGQLRRNRSHLIETSASATTNETPSAHTSPTSTERNSPPTSHDTGIVAPSPNTTMYRPTSRYGRPIKKPERLDL